MLYIIILAFIMQEREYKSREIRVHSYKTIIRSQKLYKLGTGD